MGRRLPRDWNTRRKKVYRRDSYKCQNCGRRGGRYRDLQLEAHHIVPRSKGGSHKLSNLITVCEDCHNSIHGGGLAPSAANVEPEITPDEWAEEQYQTLSKQFNVSYEEVKELANKSDEDLQALGDGELNKRHIVCPACVEEGRLSMEWRSVGDKKRVKVITCEGCDSIFEENVVQESGSFHLEPVDDISEIETTESAFAQELERQQDAKAYREQSEKRETKSPSKYRNTKRHGAVAALTDWWSRGLGGATYTGHKRATSKSKQTNLDEDADESNEEEGIAEEQTPSERETSEDETDKEAQEKESEGKVGQKDGPCPKCGTAESFKQKIELRREFAWPFFQQCTACEAEFVEGHQEDTKQELFSYPEEALGIQAGTSPGWQYGVPIGVALAVLAMFYSHPILIFLGWIALPIAIYHDLRYVRTHTDSRPSTPRWFWSSMIPFAFINIIVGCAYLIWRQGVWR